MTGTEVLRVENLNVRFGTGPRALHPVRNFSLRVERGSAHGIVGESGSGKSMAVLSLMNLLPGNARRSVDRFDLNGADLSRMPDAQFARDIAGKKIAMIFQDPMMSLNPVYTIGRQLTEAVVPRAGETREAIWRRAVGLLDRVGVPRAAERMRQYPFQLSGGLRQRVMIAMALMNEPDLLIADEPTTALDASTQLLILDLITDLRRQMGMAVILITHDVGVISRAVDDVTVMYAGEVVESGPKDEVIGHPQHPYTRGLLSCLPGKADRSAMIPAIPGAIPSTLREIHVCAFADRCALVHDACLRATPAMRFAGERHAYRCVLEDPVPGTRAPRAALQAIPAGADAAPLIRIENLRRVYALRHGPFRPATKLVAVDDVSLDVRKGEVLAIVGESGSGKSTVAKMLLGLEAPDAGRIAFDGRPLDSLSQGARARAMQAVFQDPYSSLNPRLTIGQSVRRPLDVHGIGTRAEREEKVLAILDRIGLGPAIADAYPAQLSGGQRQRAAIARAVILRPTVVVCDEPTSALDVSIQAQILNLLREMQGEFNLTYVLITHDLGVVRYLADRVVVFEKGRIVEAGTCAQVLGDPRHQTTRALLEAAA